MAVHKQYKLFFFGDEDEAKTSLTLEDVSGRVSMSDKRGVYELTITDPSVETTIPYDNDIVLHLTREELGELSAVCRVLLGDYSSEDKVLSDGPNALD